MSDQKKLYLPKFCVVPLEARLNPDIPDSAKIYLGELNVLTNQHGYCWASDADLAEMKGVSTSTINNWHRILEKHGFIKRHTYRTHQANENGKLEVRSMRKMYVFEEPSKNVSECQKSGSRSECQKSGNRNKQHRNDENCCSVLSDEKGCEKTSEEVVLFEDSKGEMQELTKQQLTRLIPEAEPDAVQEIWDQLQEKVIKISNIKSYVSKIAETFKRKHVRRTKHAEGKRKNQPRANRSEDVYSQFRADLESGKIKTRAQWLKENGIEE